MKALRATDPCSPQGCTRFKEENYFRFESFDWNAMTCPFGQDSVCRGECENYLANIFLELSFDVLMSGSSLMTESIDAGRNTINYRRKLLDDLKEDIVKKSIFGKKPSSSTKNHQHMDKNMKTKGDWPTEEVMEDPIDAYKYSCSDAELAESLNTVHDMGFSRYVTDGGGIDGGYVQSDEINDDHDVEEGSNGPNTARSYVNERRMSSKGHDLSKIKKGSLYDEDELEDDGVDYEGLQEQNYESTDWVPPSLEKAEDYRVKHSFHGGTSKMKDINMTKVLDFGTGVPLYFQFIKSFAILFFLMASLCLVSFDLTAAACVFSFSSIVFLCAESFFFIASLLIRSSAWPTGRATTAL